MSQEDVVEPYEFKGDVSGIYFPDNPILKCTVPGCKKTSHFKSHSTLMNHLWICHKIGNDIHKVYQCDVNGCEYQHKYKYRIEHHKVTQHNLQPKKMFHCDVVGCDYQNGVRKNLRLHMITKHPEPDDPLYICSDPTCSYESRIKSNFKKHMRKHGLTSDNSDSDPIDFIVEKENDQELFIVEKE